MVFFDQVSTEAKKKLGIIWKSMSQEDKEHFINQVALALSVLGSDEKGKKLVVELLGNMLEDGSRNLADVGLYLEFLDEAELKGKEDKFKKAQAMLESYRFKHDLPSEPSKEFFSS
ncbi:MAG: hypothetical protein PHS02_01505 [Candidatus ainarchaeum sp.]|nr:hypothetical protein [Candidatus ainarchaeum sp.]